MDSYKGMGLDFADINADGLFDIVWQAPGPIRPDPYLSNSRFEDVWLEA